jgi:hypothetical protein
MQSQKQHQAHLLPRRSLYAFRLPVAARTHALMLSTIAQVLCECGLEPPHPFSVVLQI